MQRESLGRYSSKVCIEDRCVSTPVRKGHVEPCPGRRKVFFLSQQQPPTSKEHSRKRSASSHPHEANEQIRRFIWGGGGCKSATTTEAHQIQNKQLDNSSQPRPKPKTTIRVDFQKGFLYGGSDGVDHVAIEVLQHDVANRGSRCFI